VSPAKMAEPIEMLLTRVGPENHVLDWGPDLPMGRGNFEEGNLDFNEVKNDGGGNGISWIHA